MTVAQLRLADPIAVGLRHLKLPDPGNLLQD